MTPLDPQSRRKVAALIRVCSAILLFPFSNVSALQDAASTSTARETAPVVAGKVCAPGGAPIPGASVQLELVNATLPTLPEDAVVAQATTDGAGNYALSGTRAGKYLLRAAANSFRASVQDLTLKSGERRRIDVILQVGDSAGPAKEGTDKPPAVQFSDEPNFAIAGITDRSN